MNCPMFIDYTRECVEHVKIVPEVNTFKFCTTEHHKECPFYKTIKKIGVVCEYISTCVIYKRLSIVDFDKFMETTKKYCLSKDSVNCQRYITKKSGKTPPDDLLPEGTSLKA
ncbi:MAG: hypothetical protein PHP46_01635 [Candidatus Omnitrophica bacterium]|nr:hypothetical protein [Candidatus Omnitrophota bacterium]